MEIEGSLRSPDGTIMYYTSDNDTDSSDSLQLFSDGILSPSSNSFLELYRIACQYVKENKNYEILVLIPQINQFPVLPPIMHLLFGCTLFKLGRIGGALREVSMAIELETVQKRKECSIKTLIDLFRKLGMKEHATACFGELLFNSARTPDEENTLIYERQLSKLLLEPLTKSNFVEKMEKLSLKMQLQNWICAEGTLAPASFVQNCKTVDDLVEEATNILMEWKITGHKNSDPVTPIVRAITFLPPCQFFLQLFEHEELLLDFMNQDITNHPEVDYSISAKRFKRVMKVWSSQKASSSLCHLLIKHKIILGYLDFYKNNYSEAFTTFVWISSVVKDLRKIYTDPMLPKTIDIVVSIYATQCCSFVNQQRLAKQRLEKTFSMMVLQDEFSIDDINAGIMGKFFVTCGMVYEKMAYSHASEQIIESKESHANIQTCLKLSKPHLNEMIRKYIIATTCMNQDDPSLMFVYDRVLWGLLVYGGIHLQTLWFFLALKNHKSLELDYAPLHLCPEHDYRLFDSNESLARYDNAWEIIDRSYDLRHDIDISETSSWDKSHGNTFLIPQIYVQGDSLVFHDETPKSDTKIKSCLKRDKTRDYENDIEFSMELIRMWKKSYKEHNGEIPDIALDPASINS